MRPEKIANVVRFLDIERVSPDEVSPNMVNHYANKYGITDLTYEEVIYISNNY